MKGLDLSPTVRRERAGIPFQSSGSEARVEKLLTQTVQINTQERPCFVSDSQRCVEGKNWICAIPASLFAASDHFSFLFNAWKT